jgi:hypothetical protein
MDYSVLIAAWNSTTQPPAGVTGAGLLTADTTAQKLAKVRAWTINGASVPMIIPTTQIYNAIVPSEFQALSAAQQQYIRDILSLGNVYVSSGTNARAVLLQVFPSATQTHTNFIALAKEYDTPQIPWWEANGFPANISGSDISNAGLT